MTTTMNQEEIQAATRGVMALLEATRKPYKPLTSKVERYIEKQEIKALEDAEKEATSSKSVFMTEPPKYGMTDKQKQGAKVGRNNINDIWVGNGGCNE